jgi:hypothetical protein
MTKKDPWNSKTALIVGILALVILFSSFYIMNQPPAEQTALTPKGVHTGVVSVNIIKIPEPVGIVTGKVTVNILPRVDGVR